jgi:hypothetical protein
MSTTFWVNDPTILIRTDTLSQLWPTKEMTMNENLNAITRLTILLSCLGYLISKNYRVIIAGAITIFAIIILKYSKRSSKPAALEGYSNLTQLPKDLKKYEPTEKNPLMNVVLPEIQENPERPEAELSYMPDVVDNINKKTQDMIVSNFDNPDGIRDKLFRDLGDNFQFDRSMIQFTTNANTQIPNDQTSFAEFCYGGMTSCKTGDPGACLKTMPPQWMNL